VGAELFQADRQMDRRTLRS